MSEEVLPRLNVCEGVNQTSNPHTIYIKDVSGEQVAGFNSPPANSCEKASSSSEPLEEDSEVVRLLSALRSLCTSDNYDLVLQAGDTKVSTHSALLKARSPFMARQLEAEEISSIIKLDWIEGQVLTTVVNYLYTGQVDVSPSTLVDLLEAGSRLELPSLIARCLTFLHQLEVEGSTLFMTEVLVAAVRLDLDQVREVAVERLLGQKEVLMGDQMFRTKMVENPTVLWVLYQALVRRTLVETDNGTRHSRFWHCYSCGSTSQGSRCSWCGGLQQF